MVFPVEPKDWLIGRLVWLHRGLSMAISLTYSTLTVSGREQ